MKRSLLVLALATPFLAGCMATAMKTGEGMLRNFAGNGGALSGAATIAADVHRDVRAGVFGDTTPAVGTTESSATPPLPKEETAAPAPVTTPVPAAPPPKKQPVAKKEGAKKS